VPFTINPVAYDDMASLFDEAINNGQLPNPGLKVEIDESNKANTSAYIQVIRSRLIDLGYIGDTTDNRSRIEIDTALKKAIRKFQTEAGLEVIDSWAGPKTFKVLQQLVSFEEEQDPLNWKTLISRLDLPAINRAVYLRLYTLGFFNWKDKLNTRIDVSLKNNNKFKMALNNFLKNALELNIIKTHLQPELSIDVLRALFQQDEIIHSINLQPKFALNPANKTFIESIARIELWLLGYDVNIGNPQTIYKRRKSRNKIIKSKRRKKTTRLSIALEDFWRIHPVEKQPESRNLRQSVTPEFFKELVILSSEDSDSETTHSDVVTHVQKLSKNDKKKLQNKLQGLASSIWDGVKRVFRWIKRFIKKIAKKALNIIKNIARYIAKRARSAFEIIQKATEILHRGIVYLRKEYLPGSTPRHIVIKHDKDFDTSTFINYKGDRLVINQLLDKNIKESLYLKSACKILAHIISILRKIAKGFTTGIAGWFLILLALCRIRLNIKEIIKEVKHVIAAEVEKNASPYVNLVI